MGVTAKETVQVNRPMRENYILPKIDFNSLLDKNVKMEDQNKHQM